MILTDKQYQVLLDLFNELNDDFQLLSEETLKAFYDRLYANLVALTEITGETIMSDKKPSLPVIAKCLNNCIEKHQEKHQELHQELHKLAIAVTYETPAAEDAQVFYYQVASTVRALQIGNSGALGYDINRSYQQYNAAQFKYLLDALLAAKQAAHGKE